MKTRIPYARPSITDLEVSYATDAARNGWGDHCYDYIARFESGLSHHLGVRHAIATSSCTGALHMGLAALGVGLGDEVIVPDSTWIATVAPVCYLGATPVFVDILPDTWCIDPEQVRAAITPRTKAIIAVHLYGNLCDMDRLLQIGATYDIPVIEDAAEAIGSVYRSRPAGSMGRFGVFSFHGTKTLTTGEGGMFVTDDLDLHEKVLTLSNHGRSRSQTRQFWPDTIGFKYKMSNIQAAIGCAQLERITELVSRKRQLFQQYHAVCNGVQGLAMNPEPPGTTNAFWMPTVVFGTDLGMTQERLLEIFNAEDIDARVFFSPLSTHPSFHSAAQTRVSHDIARRAVNLPAFHDIRRDEQERVIATVNAIASGEFSRPRA
jgi:perosamine synthetase